MLRVEKTQSSTSSGETILYQDYNDIDWLVQMERTRGDTEGAGGIRFRCSRRFDTGVMAFGLPLSISLVTVKQTAGAWRAPTSYVFMEAHTVRFNGTDGSPRIHPDAAVQMDGLALRRVLF